ncbi:MAG: NUDIX domain-containing protein [Myxococcota bacterium]|jgi:8-oxo-dGTP pyrophosphatase MutT (NUDIX family)|nr:NUDIX domain-containing protein [Myxococcota bacterium]
MTKDKVEPKLAATIMLLRDSANHLEVFMVERHHQIDFATGALVFPGGKAEEADGGASMREYCAGVDDLDDDAITVRVTAIRETFEESGVLLARPQGSDQLVNADKLAQLEARYRSALQKDEIDLQSVVESEALILACDQLTPFAHWITPDMLPKRFDTHFFLAVAPGDQLALHDGSESVDSVWTTPGDALRAESDGQRTIVFATLANLQKLGRSADMAQAIEAARKSSITTVLPWVAKEDDGELMLCIPAEADYGMTKVPLSGLRG